MFRNLAETYPIAMHWTAHSPSHSSCNITTTKTNNTSEGGYTSNNNNRWKVQKEDGVVVVHVAVRDITCTMSSTASTVQIVHPRELVDVIKLFI